MVLKLKTANRSWQIMGLNNMDYNKVKYWNTQRVQKEIDYLEEIIGGGLGHRVTDVQMLDILYSIKEKRHDD